MEFLNVISNTAAGERGSILKYLHAFKLSHIFRLPIVWTRLKNTIELFPNNEQITMAWMENANSYIQIVSVIHTQIGIETTIKNAIGVEFMSNKCAILRYIYIYIHFFLQNTFVICFHSHFVCIFFFLSFNSLPLR